MQPVVYRDSHITMQGLVDFVQQHTSFLELMDLSDSHRAITADPSEVRKSMVDWATFSINLTTQVGSFVQDHQGLVRRQADLLEENRFLKAELHVCQTSSAPLDLWS